MISPLIRIRVAQLLARKYKLDPEKAVQTAEDLVKMLQSANLDIVLSSWVNNVGVDAPKGDFWDKVSEQMSQTEAEYGAWRPWAPYEKEN